jgi:cation diffusion facilitator CzcD-associated flavoprotein CzcO
MRDQSTAEANRGVATDTAGAARESNGGQPAREVEVLILGAGVSGIAAGIGLKRAGITDFVIVDRSDEIGGTWHHNRYPGCAVDIPTHAYSFSFALNPNWSRVFAPQQEIEDYLLGVVDKYGLRERIALNTEVLEAAWDDDAQRWHVATSSGVYLARAFVIAPGPLHEAVKPPLPGLGAFKGTAFHSSTWPTDLDLSGRRVVSIGTGASAIQFLPAIQRQVEQLTVLQRTPSWVMPKLDWRTSAAERRLLARLPFLMRLERWAIWGPMDLGLVIITRHPRVARLTSLIAKAHMRRFIKDRSLRRDLTPDYLVTCKRVGLSNNYYRTFAQSNVELVTSPAAEIREHSVVTADGREFECDTIIYGTGFYTLPHHPINERVRGRDGRSLADVWQGCPKAYMGTTMPGFPNAFFMFGPNIGTLSGFVMAEAQTDYIVGALDALRRNGLSSIDVRAEAQDAFVREVDQVLEGSTLAAAVGGCTSYYLDDQQRVALAWPWTMMTMRRRLKRFELEPYEVRTAAPARVP